MSEQTTNPNGSRKEMNVKASSNIDEVIEKIEEAGYCFQVAATVVQVTNQKILPGEITEGDTINRAGDIVLAANPKEKPFVPEEIAKGSSANLKDAKKKPKSKARKDNDNKETEKEETKHDDDIVH